MFENLKFARWKPNYIGMEEIHSKIRKIIQSGLEVEYKPSKYITKDNVIFTTDSMPFFGVDGYKSYAPIKKYIVAFNPSSYEVNCEGILERILPIDGEKVKDCPCGGRRYVEYCDEARLYHIFCEKCDLEAYKLASSLDDAINDFNELNLIN